MSTIVTENTTESLASLVADIEAVAEQARLHGPAPDCEARMDQVIGKHRDRIESARRVEREALRGSSDAD